MLKILRHKLVEQSLIYVAFDTLNKGIPFLLLPILTRLLETEEYGIIAMFAVFSNILAVFTGISVHGAVNVNYFRMGKSEFKVFVANVFIVLAASSLIVFAIIFLSRNFFAEFLELPEIWVLIAVIVASSQFITTINLVLWQVEQRAKYFGWYQFFFTLFNIGVSLYLVVHLDMGWAGRLTGMAGATIFFSVISLFVIFNRGYLTFKFNLDAIKDALKFGVPLIPHQFSGWVRTSLDRIFLTTMVGIGATGLYSAGYQVGLIIGILATAFSRAFSPFLFEKLKEVDEVLKRTIVKVSYLYFFGITLFAIILGLLSQKYLPVILGTKYAESAEVVLWVALGYAFNGMYLVVVQFIFYEKKTHWLSAISFTGALIHAGLCYILIGAYGAMGAAYATTLSYLATFFLTWILSARIYKMPWLKAFNEFRKT